MTCPLGLGRLCAVTDAGGSESYAYDAFGNRTGVQRTELGVSYQTDYTYDARDRLASIVHAPDGRLVSYTRDALGRISAVSTTVGGVATTLVSNRQYRGDGLLATQVFGNGLAETRSHDLRGWALSQAVGAVDARSYGAYDPNGNLLSLQGSAVAATFGYDALDRLSAETRPGISYGYLYDANGNRTRSTTNGTAVEAVYVAQSNRLATLAGAQVTYDAAGNLTLAGAKAFGYNAAGRLATVTDAGVPKATYVHAHTGARSRKVLSGSTLVFARDDAGQLLREHRANGSLVRLYVWADAEPIAQIERALDGSETLAYLHTDRQAVPRLATNAAATVVWRFEARAFGEGGAQTDPDGDGTTLNVRLRYPGQYFDSESGLFDNYFRDYDPGTGRYIESDPVGLAGGLNTYAYVYANPLRYADPYGLWTWPSPGDVARYWGETGAAAGDMYHAYGDMKDAGTRGADAYFHCKANCEASKRGPAGQDVACSISNAREAYQDEPVADRARDDSANAQGQKAGQQNPNADCYRECASLIPPWGIPRRHLPPYANPDHVYMPAGGSNAP